MRQCELLDLGRLEWMKAFRIQQQFVEETKREGGIDRFLFVEHPHVVTMGRNAQRRATCWRARRFWRAPASHSMKRIGAAE